MLLLKYILVGVSHIYYNPIGGSYLQLKARTQVLSIANTYDRVLGRVPLRAR